MGSGGTHVRDLGGVGNGNDSVHVEEDRCDPAVGRAGLEGALCSRDGGRHPCKSLSCVQPAHSQRSGQTADVSLSRALSKAAGGAGRMRVGASAREGRAGPPAACPRRGLLSPGLRRE